MTVGVMAAGVTAGAGVATVATGPRLTPKLMLMPMLNIGMIMAMAGVVTLTVDGVAGTMVLATASGPRLTLRPMLKLMPNTAVWVDVAMVAGAATVVGVAMADGEATVVGVAAVGAAVGAPNSSD